MRTRGAARLSSPSGGAVALAVGLLLSAVGVASAAGVALSSAHMTIATRTYGAARTCTLTATADSYVNKALATTNFGGATTLLISADSTVTERTFVSFALSGCSPSIPADALVQSARLQLTVSLLAPTTRTYDLRRATAAWVESTVTWNAQPAVAASTSASTTVTAGTLAGTVIEWTATGDVQSYVTGAATDLGWRVSDSAEGIVPGSPLTLGSREAASGQPHLVVTYLP